MARLSIPDELTFNTFTVTTPTTVFPFDFAIFAKADLRVLVDGAALEQSDFTLSGTLLEGGGYAGGSITLNDAVDDVTVQVERHVAPVRASQFAPSASVPVQSIDQAFNRAVAATQDARRDVDQALRVPLGEAAGNVPGVSDRRGRVLGFADTAGAEPVAVPNDSVAVASDLLQAAIARAGAEAAEAAAEAQVVEAQAEVAQASDFASQSGVQRAAAEAARDEAELAVTAIPVGTIYETEAAGIAAVADGDLFWCVATDADDALELRQRDDATSDLLKVTPSIASANRGNVVPVIQENVSGNNWMLAPASGSTFNGDGTDSIYVFRVTPADSGLGIFMQVAGFNSGDPRALRWPDGDQVLDGDLTLGTTAEMRFKTAGANTGSWTLLSPARPPQVIKSNFVKVEQTNASDNEWELAPTAGNTFIGDGSAAVYAFTVEVDHTSGLGITAEIAGFNTADPRMVVYPDGGQIVPGQLTVGTEVQLTFNSSGALLGRWTMLTPARPRSADTTTLTSFYARGAAARAVQQGYEA